MSGSTIPSFRAAHGELAELRVTAARLRVPHLLEAIGVVQRMIDTAGNARRVHPRLVQILLCTRTLVRDIVSCICDGAGYTPHSALHLRSLLTTLHEIERFAGRLAMTVSRDGEMILSQADDNMLTGFNEAIQTFMSVFRPPLFPEIDTLLERSQNRLAYGYTYLARFFGWS